MPRRVVPCPGPARRRSAGAARLPAALLFAAAFGIAALALLGASGCSTRRETPTVAADSTLVYAGKKAGDVEAGITFASRVGKKSGKRYGVATAFDMEDDAKVIAVVDLKNLGARGDRPLTFHLVWLKPSGLRLFKKQIEVDPAETEPTLTSSISIPPGKRNPGMYTFQVYLYRELIAEKRFLLRGIGAEADEEEEEEL